MRKRQHSVHWIKRQKTGYRLAINNISSMLAKKSSVCTHVHSAKCSTACTNRKTSYCTWNITIVWIYCHLTAGAMSALWPKYPIGVWMVASFMCAKRTAKRKKIEPKRFWIWLIVTSGLPLALNSNQKHWYVSFCPPFSQMRTFLQGKLCRLCFLSENQSFSKCWTANMIALLISFAGLFGDCKTANCWRVCGASIGACTPSEDWNRHWLLHNRNVSSEVSGNFNWIHLKWLENVVLVCRMGFPPSHWIFIYNLPLPLN